MQDSQNSVAQSLADGDTAEKLEFWVSNEVFLELRQTVVCWERGCLCSFPFETVYCSTRCAEVCILRCACVLWSEGYIIKEHTNT